MTEGVRALGLATCRVRQPSTDAEAMTAASEAWPAAIAAMRDAATASLEDIQRLFDGMCRWRAGRTRWVASGPRARRRAAVHYILEAAARLTLIDWVHSSEDTPTVAATNARGIAVVRLAVAEEDALQREDEELVRRVEVPRRLQLRIERGE